MLPGFMYLKINNDNTLILVIENIEFRHRQLYFTFFFLYKTFYGVKANKNDSNSKMQWYDRKKMNTNSNLYC